MSKKGKKTKGKTLPLNEFLATGPTPGVAPVVTRKLDGSWADDVDDDDTDTGRRVVLPTAPRSTWGTDVDDSIVPRDPPYTAFLSNLPFETEEDELYNVFRDLRVHSVRLPGGDRGKRGCGYVEFEDRGSLISALSMIDTQLKGRNIRIAVADNVSDDRRRGMRDRERGLDPDRSSAGDWRSGPRDEPPPRDSWDGQRRGFGDRFGDRDRGGFGSRERFGDRGGFPSSGGGRFEDRDRRSFGPRGFDERDGPRRDDFPSGEPSQRPRLNLQPRTKPLEEVAAPIAKPPEPAPATGAKAASVFGGAKPVDTAAREREIEERLARERGMLGVGAGGPPSTARDSRGRERDWDRDRDRFSSTSSDRRREDSWRNPPAGTGGDSSDGGRTSPYGSDRGRRAEQGRGGGSGQSSLDRQSQSRSWSNDRDERPRTGGSTPAPRSEGAYIPPRGRTEMRSPSLEQERVPVRSRDRDSSQEESARMPKYHEEETPSFTASNKFAYLPSEDDPQAAGSD
ncbi:eukaryotic translation initiation factor 4B-like isoform X2 [Schistocerca gregaria]|uniref:eukaryotic translation initiation factor 4B-like isoform X2 n=1 Tax=Schistocerca gregaria TaxID=7010 RepID=UPI00211EEB9D|nr:eukaryotic translation initiation factor 4B-like isoform X2 [Schistocerca gregaria]